MYVNDLDDILSIHGYQGVCIIVCRQHYSRV
jgi:hypothetical protein